MASSGPVSGSVAANDATGGSQDWVNPDGALGSDGSYATLNTAGATGKYLKVTGFGFSIPSGATIDGIVVDVERSVTGSGLALDSTCKLTKAGTIQGTAINDGNFWTTTDTYVAHGTSTSLWGSSWSDSDINDSGFGFAIQIVMANAGSARIDDIQITVYYTTAAGGAMSQRSLPQSMQTLLCR